MISVVMSLVSGCATIKYRWKNVNGDRSEEQLQKDWKDCYEHSTGQHSMNRCVEKKGYYSESFIEEEK